MIGVFGRLSCFEEERNCFAGLHAVEWAERRRDS
jgi:hypothetical protein